MDQNTEELSCSFCSKNKDEVSRLIAGPGVYICDECIDSCYNLIKEQSIKDKKDQHQDWDSLLKIYLIHSTSMSSDNLMPKKYFRSQSIITTKGLNPITFQMMSSLINLIYY